MGRIVIACYRPRPGKKEELERLILDHVATLRAEGLVTDRDPITMSAQDGTVVEVFEWASSAAIEKAHANPAVLRMWEQYGEVCDYIPVGQVAEAAQMFSEFAPIEGVRHSLRKASGSTAVTKLVKKPPTTRTPTTRPRTTKKAKPRSRAKA
jgi:quinol monooxygenase YgiN